VSLTVVIFSQSQQEV